MAEADAKLRISAENRTKSAFDEIRRSITDTEGAAAKLRGALGALGGVATLGLLASQFRDLIGAASNLDDLAEKTGASVEELSKLSQVARISGVSLETVETTLIRLTKALAGGDEEAKGAGKALAALGLSAEKLQGLDTAVALRTIAGELDKFADGAGKSALALALFGKSGAQALPLLKDLASEQGIAARVTAEQAARAEELEKSLRRLANASSIAKTDLALGLVPALQSLVNEFNEGKRIAGGFLDAILLFGTINPFRATVDNIKAVTKELEELQAARARYLSSNSDTRSIDQSIDTLRKRAEFLKFQQREEALALGGKNSAGEDRRFFAKPVLVFRDEAKPAGAAKVDNRFDNAIKQLEDEAVKVQDLTRVEEILAAVQLGRYGEVNAAQRDQLVGLAAAVDLAKEDVKVQKEVEELLKRGSEERARKQLAEGERLSRLAAEYKDLIDPVERYRRQLLEIEDLFERGLLTSDQFREATFAIQNKIEDMQQLKDEVKKTDDLAKELGLTFSSAFEDAVVNGKKLSDVLRGLAQDASRVFLRKFATEPLANAAGAFLKDFSISSLLSGLPFGGARAEGGPVSPGSAYLVGERGPELFIPNSAGSIAPGAGDVIVHQHISFSANTPAAVRDAVLAMAPELSRQAVRAVRDDRNRSGDRR